MSVPGWLHIGFVVLISGFFLFKFMKERKLYQLLLVLWTPSTLLQYILKDVWLSILGIFQVVMFALVVYSLTRQQRKLRRDLASRISKYAKENPDSVDNSSM